MAIEYKVIGRHIRAARTQKRMTQEEVAEAIEMSCAHYGKVERGERPVNLHRLSQLCILLDVSLESLIEGAVATEDGSLFTPSPSNNPSDFLSRMEIVAKGCSEPSLRLMLRLCADVAEADKTELLF